MAACCNRDLLGLIDMAVRWHQHRLKTGVSVTIVLLSQCDTESESARIVKSQVGGEHERVVSRILFQPVLAISDTPVPSVLLFGIPPDAAKCELRIKDQTLPSQFTLSMPVTTLNQRCTIEPSHVHRYATQYSERRAVSSRWVDED